MKLRSFTVTKSGKECRNPYYREPYSSGENKYTVQWKACGQPLSEPEYLRDIVLKVEVENEENKEKEEATVPFANLPYEDLEKFFDGGLAKIVWNGKSAKMVHVKAPVPGNQKKFLN